MTRPAKVGVCARCGRTGRMMARGLDVGCYKRMSYHGTLEDWPRLRRTDADLVANMERVRADGCSWSEVARRLGYAHGKSACTTYSDAKRRLAAKRGA